MKLEKEVFTKIYFHGMPETHGNPSCLFINRVKVIPGLFVDSINCMSNSVTLQSNVSLDMKVNKGKFRLTRRMGKGRSRSFFMPASVVRFIERTRRVTPQ